MKKFIFTFVLVLATLSASAQYRVDRLVTAGRSALFYEDFVLSIKYFNLAIGAKPYLYEPWYYRYVGSDAAREITDQGLCLEEYLDSTGTIT